MRLEHFFLLKGGVFACEFIGDFQTQVAGIDVGLEFFFDVDLLLRVALDAVEGFGDGDFVSLASKLGVTIRSDLNSLVMTNPLRLPICFIEQTHRPGGGLAPR